MTNTPPPARSPLDELTTEQLLIAYRHLPRIPAGVNRSAIKDMERYLEDARRRDTNNAELEAEFVRLLDKLDEHNAEIDTLRAQLAQRGEWEPLPDGVYHTDSAVLLKVEGAQLHVYDTYPAVVDLPMGMALCRFACPECYTQSWRTDMEDAWPSMPDVEGKDMFEQYPVMGEENE